MAITTSENDIKERLSLACLIAIAARAGCQLGKTDLDKQSVDATVHPISGRKLSIDVQLKSTSADCFEGENVVFDLPAKNYADLIDPYCTAPHFLLLLVLPFDRELWLKQDEAGMVVGGAIYWASLLGRQPVHDKTKIRIRIPRFQLFTHTTLIGMMQAESIRVEAGREALL